MRGPRWRRACKGLATSDVRTFGSKVMVTAVATTTFAVFNGHPYFGRNALRIEAASVDREAPKRGFRPRHQRRGDPSSRC